MVLIGFALTTAVTGNEAAHLPAAVEELTPVFDAMQVPQQATVIADLADGYEGRLIVDGVELPTIRQDEIGNIDIKPGEQVTVPPGAVYEPGNATLTFTPGDGQADRQLRRGPPHGDGHLLEDPRRARPRPLLHLAFTSSTTGVRQLAGLEELDEGVLVEDGHADLLGLGDLAGARARRRRRGRTSSC